MTEIDAQIIDLLNKGWSYSRIQEELQVSSKTIAAARKAHFPGVESNTGVLSGDTFLRQPQSPPIISENPFKPNQIKFNNQKPKKMSTENDYFENDNEITSQLELEKYRLQLEHEREMEKIQVGREERDRDYNLRAQEIELAKKKAEEVERALLYRIKTIAESCENREYSFEEAEELLEEATKVLSDCEQYFFIKNITFPGCLCHSLLTKIISTLTDFLDGMDEDDSKDLEFESAFHRTVSRYTFHAF